MLEHTRNFRDLLSCYVLEPEALNLDVQKEISDKIQRFIKDESSSTTEITVYFLGFTLYFILHSPPYPPDTHMKLPLTDNPSLEAVFLDKDVQHPQVLLNGFPSIVYL